MRSAQIVWSGVPQQKEAWRAGPTLTRDKGLISGIALVAMIIASAPCKDFFRAPVPSKMSPAKSWLEGTPSASSFCTPCSRKLEPQRATCHQCLRPWLCHARMQNSPLRTSSLRTRPLTVKLSGCASSFCTISVPVRPLAPVTVTCTSALLG